MTLQWISASALAVFTVGLIGCKQDNSEPVPPSPSTKSPPQSAAQDLQVAREIANQKTPGTQQGTPTTPPNQLPVANMRPGGSSSADAVTYTAPPDWKSQPVTSQMRKAQFLIPRAPGDTDDGQMVVFYFGDGQGGALEPNISRWKGMFSTADGQPVPENSVKRETQEVNGLKVTTLDISGRYVDPMAGRTTASPQDWRMLSAIVETPKGNWFFKSVGPAATMKAQEQNFKTFVGSIKSKA